MIVLVVGGLLFGLVYGLIGNLSERGIHLLATAPAFGLLGAFLLGLQVGRAHIKGVERGDLKISARERTQQTTRPVVTQPTSAQRFDDLLPQVKRAAIVTRQDDDATPIEL